jgi:hypothetical protein
MTHQSERNEKMRQCKSSMAFEVERDVTRTSILVLHEKECS